MKTLININNHSKITVPDIFIGGCCYIFNEDFLNMKQQDGNVFLNKDEWILEEELTMQINSRWQSTP